MTLSQFSRLRDRAARSLRRGKDNQTVADETREGRLSNCPECGVDLDTVDIGKHIRYHWPARMDPADERNKGALDRISLLQAEQEARTKEAAK